MSFFCIVFDVMFTICNNISGPITYIIFLKYKSEVKKWFFINVKTKKITLLCMRHIFTIFGEQILKSLFYLFIFF